jgi:hypothetical protein
MGFYQKMLILFRNWCVCKGVRVVLVVLSLGWVLMLMEDKKFYTRFVICIVV